MHYQALPGILHWLSQRDFEDVLLQFPNEINQLYTTSQVK